MEDVFAAKHDRWLIAQATDHADTAVILLAVVLVKLEVRHLLIVRLDTFFVETRKAATLALEATAFVAAWENFRARLVHQVNAGLLTTNVHECWLVGQ